MSGKGDKQRPTDKKTFNKNFEAIFNNRKSKLKKKEIKNENKTRWIKVTSKSIP